MGQASEGRDTQNDETGIPAGEIAERLGRVADAKHWLTVAAENGDTDAMLRLIEEHGPYEIRGETTIMRPLDRLLQAFVEQHRMKLPGGSAYEPCYRVVD